MKREKKTDGRYESNYIDNSKHGWINSLIKGRHVRLDPENHQTIDFWQESNCRFKATNRLKSKNRIKHNTSRNHRKAGMGILISDKTEL